MVRDDKSEATGRLIINKGKILRVLEIIDEFLGEIRWRRVRGRKYTCIIQSVSLIPWTFLITWIHLEFHNENNIIKVKLEWN